MLLCTNIGPGINVHTSFPSSVVLSAFCCAILLFWLTPMWRPSISVCVTSVVPRKLSCNYFQFQREGETEQHSHRIWVKMESIGDSWGLRRSGKKGKGRRRRSGRNDRGRKATQWCEPRWTLPHHFGLECMHKLCWEGLFVCTWVCMLITLVVSHLWL